MAQLHNPNTRRRTAAGQFMSSQNSPRLVISKTLENINYLVERMEEEYQSLSTVDRDELVTWKTQAADIQQRLSDCWEENRDE